jgi:hypothetical protein
VAREFDGKALSAALDAKRRAEGLSCQHALSFLRWLDRTPEGLLAGTDLDAGEPLPACGPDRRPRWDSKALRAGCNESRTRRGATWAQAAQELRCQPGQLTGLKTARFGTAIALAMRITPVGRPPGGRLHLPGALVRRGLRGGELPFELETGVPFELETGWRGRGGAEAASRLRRDWRVELSAYRASKAPAGVPNVTYQQSRNLHVTLCPADDHIVAPEGVG